MSVFHILKVVVQMVPKSTKHHNGEKLPMRGHYHALTL